LEEDLSSRASLHPSANVVSGEGWTDVMDGTLHWEFGVKWTW
jgi:hypothetical protein